MLMSRAEGFVLSERVQRTVGVDDWFELSTRAEPEAPAVGSHPHRRGMGIPRRRRQSVC